MINVYKEVIVAKVENSIELLNIYVKDTDIKDFVSLLEELKQNPKDETIIDKLRAELDVLGITQGAILTYAPYINVLLSVDPFGD
jgi:hypothetical protein